jgi:hypothetical protein
VPTGPTSMPMKMVSMIEAREAGMIMSMEKTRLLL